MSPGPTKSHEPPGYGMAVAVVSGMRWNHVLAVQDHGKIYLGFPKDSQVWSNNPHVDSSAERTG